jgi:surfeit locus 1 family protein
VKRFPVGLTVAAVLTFTLLVGLGVWQLQRLGWKQNLLARIDALRAAPAMPLDVLLQHSAVGQDLEYRRVLARCRPSGQPTRDAYRYAVPDGQVGWRLISACRLGDEGFDGVALDRGVVTRFTGLMSPGPAAFAAPGTVIGVLRKPGAKPVLGPGETTGGGGPRVFRVIDEAALQRLSADNGIRHPLPYILAVERETPAVPGVAPAALPQDIPNNHLTYALTWFALAAIMACFYGAMLIRRLRGQ